MKTLLLILFGSAALLAQPISIGIKGGVPLTDLIETVSGTNTTAKSETKRYIVGPTVELRLPAGFGVEVDALYRRFNYSSVSSVAGAVTSLFTRGNDWEFPVLIKKRFAQAPVRPFVAGGVSFTKITGLKQSISTLTTAITSTSTPAELKNDLSTGVVVGAGVELHALLLKVTPEIRYTRWGTRHFSGLFTNTNQNQAEFLIGLTF